MSDCTAFLGWCILNTCTSLEFPIRKCEVWCCGCCCCKNLLMNQKIVAGPARSHHLFNNASRKDLIPLFPFYAFPRSLLPFLSVKHLIRLPGFIYSQSVLSERRRDFAVCDGRSYGALWNTFGSISVQFINKKWTNSISVNFFAQQKQDRK